MRATFDSLTCSVPWEMEDNKSARTESYVVDRITDSLITSRVCYEFIIVLRSSG